MSQLSKFINLVIEYGQKLQSTLNKKYKPFIRSICNLQQLAKRVDPQHIFLTHQIIIFKLGLQAKSTKSIQVSLFYLQKFFGNKFIDLSLPNYCQQFQIDQSTVRKKQNIVPKGQMRIQILKLLQPLVHFKNTQINILLLKVYQYLITQPIAPMLIQLNLLTPNTQIGQKILFNYYSYRFYIFQQVYTFTENQFRSINPLSIRNQKINQQIQSAFVNHQNLLDLVHKYVGQMVATVAKVGGKYGLCVICKQPADYFCKITKASLCGADCKKRHLQLAQKQYKLYYQATHLWKQIQQSFQALLQTLTKKQSRSILTVFVSILQKTHLFMIVKPQFRSLIGKYVTGIINMVMSYKDQQTFQIVYWMVESVTCIQFFFKQCALKLIQDKRPNFKLLISLFKALAKIFQYGKTSIELYINFDCQFNKTNILERILFQLSKICQDKYSSTMYYNKHQKTAIKNGAITLLSILAKGLNQYRVLYSQKVAVQQQILQIKQKKINLQKFVTKFNQHWLQGLKVLFNMNMVGLQSQSQIIDILLTTKGLKKQKIQQMLLNQSGRQYIDILFNKIIHAGPFMGLIQIFRIVPLKKSSVLLKHYSDFVLSRMINAKEDENDQKQEYSVTKWVGFLTTNYTLKQLQKWLYMENIKIDGQIDHGELTLGSHKTYFRHCISESYIKVFGAQLSLLQIPILYLLQTGYSLQKIYEIVTELIPICPIANWIGLCIKNVDLDRIKSGKYTIEDHSLICGSLKQCKKHAQFISQWGSILIFISKLYKLMSQNNQHHKHLTVTTQSLLLQQPIKIKQQFSILQLQQYLLMIGQNCNHNFPNYISALIKLSQQELYKQNIFFLQKTFQILQHNLVKFIKNFQIINQDFHALLLRMMKHNLTFVGQAQNHQTKGKNIQAQMHIISHSTHISRPPKTPYSSQTLIYICDMLKQLFVKILKQLSSIQKKSINYQLTNVKNEQISINQESTKQQRIQRQFFGLFEIILKSENKQANDFVMNSISMIIMVHYQLKPITWSYIILNILKQYCKSYRYQILTILQKIIKQKLQHCEHLQFQILNITIDLVDQKEVKLSIEAIHLLKDFVDLLVKQVEKRYQLQQQQEKQKQNKLNIKSNQSKRQHNQLDNQSNPNAQISHLKQQPNQNQSQNQSQNIQPKLSNQPSNLKQTSANQKQTQPNLKIQSSQSQIIPKQPSSQNDYQSSSSSSQLISTSPKKIKQYLLLIISNLIEFISYECHEGAIQILFILLKTKLPSSKLIQLTNQNDLLFNSQQIDLIINKIFKKLQSLPKELQSRGQKIMNESLFWSVRNQKYGIVKNLQECIINKYSAMSYTAMKCIKTFISMTNPKKPQDWNPIQQTLVKILGNTHLSDLLSKRSSSNKNINIQQLIASGRSIQEQQKSYLPLVQLANKLIIQRMTFEVLPNDVKIIDQLLKIYNQTLQFNDNIYLRCLLWREGLGATNQNSPPDILSLQELISYRIISTYYWSKEYQKIADFTLQIITRYCDASKKWQQLQVQYQQIQSSASDKVFELYMLCKDYWQKRRQPLKVIINYMLPKLPKICKDYKEKQKIIHGIIEGMKFCQERGPYVETIRQMTLVRS